MNRRDLLTSTGAGMALGFCAVVVVAAPGCVPEPAPAAENDPMLAMIQRCRAALAVANSMDTTEEVDAAMEPVGVLYDELESRTPRITTEQGALEALRLAHETMGHTMEAFVAPVVGAVLAYFDGRA